MTGQKNCPKIRKVDLALKLHITPGHINYIHDIIDHVFNIISKQKVNTISGVEVKLFVDTICVHGDTKNSEEILKYLHTKLQENNVKIL